MSGATGRIYVGDGWETEDPTLAAAHLALDRVIAAMPAYDPERRVPLADALGQALESVLGQSAAAVTALADGPALVVEARGAVDVLADPTAERDELDEAAAGLRDCLLALDQ